MDSFQRSAAMQRFGPHMRPFAPEFIGNVYVSCVTADHKSTVEKEQRSFSTAMTIPSYWCLGFLCSGRYTYHHRHEETKGDCAHSGHPLLVAGRGASVFKKNLSSPSAGAKYVFQSPKIQFTKLRFGVTITIELSIKLILRKDTI